MAYNTPSTSNSNVLTPTSITPPPPFDEDVSPLRNTSILIANRGEIAHRIFRTLDKLSMASILLHTQTDLQSPSLLIPSTLAKLPHKANIVPPKSVLLSGMTLEETYLSIPSLISIAKENSARAIIPGYGFLSESAEFAEACEKNGIIWIGPTAEQIRSLGLKHLARRLAHELGIPLPMGSGVLKNVNQAVKKAKKIGFPVMLKSSAGGGGIGLRCCADEEELRKEFASVKDLGKRYFADESVFIEKFVEKARHVEVQVIGDGKGRAYHLGLRDCSLQRRWQKVIEEAPATFVPENVCKAMCDAAVKLAKSVQYRSVGTVEFLYDLQTEKFFFLEVNTRLQVEHTVTEEVTGLDLVEAMVRIAFDDAEYLFEKLEEQQAIEGVSIEARIYGESPLQDFRPSTGELLEVSFPAGVRVETYVTSGTVISPLYDPLIAKIIVRSDSRNEAVLKLGEALKNTKIVGVETNLDYLKQMIRKDIVTKGTYTTTSLADFKYAATVFEVIEPGPSTTIQDFPGRVGYWNIGIPPSGPIDNYAFRVANKMLGNDLGAAALECTFSGPTLLFHHHALVSVIIGGEARCELNGNEIVRKNVIRVKTGDQLSLGTIEKGCRAYIAIRGGITAPKVLGSASTFVLGKIGGHCGRELRKGDLIRFEEHSTEFWKKNAPRGPLYTYGGRWHLRVMVGPHGFPDYFEEASFEDFFNNPWKVHYNSNRVGIRLVGPKPKWARSSGGEAGLHPSNIHDSPYSIGSISFTGDEAVILGCDGPSLGGFVIFATVITADRWKTGQMKAGDEVILVPVSDSFARRIDCELSADIELGGQRHIDGEEQRQDHTLLAVLGEIGQGDCKIVCRQAGDSAILLEFGEDCFDIRTSVRIYGIMAAHKRKPFPGVVELSPGVRSLLVSHGSAFSKTLMLLVLDYVVFTSSSQFLNQPIPSRIFYLPFAFEHSTSRAAVDRYAQTIRQDAPWLPDNVEFLRHMNGLETKNDVESIINKANFLILGLGDVFFGSPCAIPLDPRLRLFGMKYNPSRSFTAEGTVGIGGQYLCIYGIDSPGGYQLVGRTVPIWNRFAMEEGAWRFNVFDRIAFYPVSEEILNNVREEGNSERLVVVYDDPFDMNEYLAWLDKHQDDIGRVKNKRHKALLKSDAVAEASNPAPTPRRAALQHTEKQPAVNEIVIRAGVAGKCWKRIVELGDIVEKGQTLFIIEAMKMEIKILSPCRATCKGIFANPGDIFDAECWLATLIKEDGKYALGVSEMSSYNYSQ